MRRPMPASRNLPQSKGDRLIAPVGGWNAIDPIAQMPARDAIVLDNFFPRRTDVQFRLGNVSFATLPVNDLIRSLMSYNTATGSKKLFAGSDAGIYDITAGGAISAVASAATSGEWQYVNISNTAGVYLWCCNGTDDSRMFDGAAWTVLNGVSTPALTGITSANVTNVSLFKHRLMLCEANSLSFWYLPIDSIAGLAVEFPLGPIFPRGGYLVATGSWTVDSGNGVDDFFVAVTSEGEVAIYAGTDPSSASTWALQGVYYIGEPIGRRCLLKYGGDLLILTVRGLFPLSKTLQDSARPETAKSYKIHNAWVEYAGAYNTLFGWDIQYYAKVSMLVVNIPVQYIAGVSQYSYQFVMNTETGAWCRFTGIPSEVWGIFSGDLYNAQFNVVRKSWTGTNDLSYNIEGKVKTAFLYPAGYGNIARTTLARPIIVSNGDPVNLKFGIDADYGDIATSSAVSYGSYNNLFDSSYWDSAYWDGGDRIYKEWITIAHNPGRALSVRLRLIAKGVTLSWNATDFILQRGGMM